PNTKSIILIFQVTSEFEFTNFKCTSLDRDFCGFEYCFLKSVNRTFKYLSLKVNLYKTPITRVHVNLGLLKRANGYKPFLYNITVDACRYLKNPKSNPVGTFLYGIFRTFSNMNHSCPFDHDLIVEKLTSSFSNMQFTKVLPFPRGDYLFRSNWIAYDINRANADIYFTLS
ncbi:hypothetical protein KR009_003382, partial [Drosophila setifemur]